MINAKDLVLYDWKEHENLLVGMWFEAVKDGTILTAFHPSARYLSNFLTSYKGNVTLGLGIDEKGIWFACSAEAFYAGALMGIWVRQDRRHTKDVYDMAVKTHIEAFKAVDHCIAWSSNGDNVALYRRFGYKDAGTLTGVWGGEDLQLLELSKEDFYARNDGRKFKRADRPS